MLPSNSFNTPEDIFWNSLPASDNNLVTLALSAAVNVALPDSSSKSAFTCHTLELFFNLPTISPPKDACIVSNVPPL